MTTSDEEARKRNELFTVAVQQVRQVLISALEKYNAGNCQCAYPRYHQLVGIDCRGSGNSFSCWETEILISLSKNYFEIAKSDLKNEVTNEKWICKKCQSIYEYGWSDFSIAIDRQKLELTELKVKLVGKEIKKPIPLVLGLVGHSYPDKSEMDSVELEVFKNYFLEI